MIFKCDVTKEEEVKAAVEGTVAKWGALHAALASAGICPYNLMLTSKKSLDITGFKNVIDINVYGSIYLAKYASIAMSKNKQDNGERGVIIFVSSVAAEEGASA